MMTLVPVAVLGATKVHGDAPTLILFAEQQKE